jgi:hypothetical protein
MALLGFFASIGFLLSVKGDALAQKLIVPIEG